MRKLASILLFLILFATNLFAATRTVNNAPGCSDTTGAPYCTINKAIIAALPGDTIQIAAGTYPGTIATFSKPLSFVGAGPGTTGTVITKSITYNGAGPLSMRNLRIVGGGSNLKISGTGNFSGLDLADAAFVGNGNGAHGVFIKQNGTVSNVAVTRCTLTNHGQSGFLIQKGTGASMGVTNVDINNSTFDTNGEYGVRIDPFVTNLRLASSNITNNAIDGVVLIHADGALFESLTITGNRNGILFYPLASTNSIANITMTNVNASNNTRFISGQYGSGLSMVGVTGPIQNITITDSTFSENKIHGVTDSGAVSGVSIGCSIIAGNLQEGIHEASSPSVTLRAENVYWGCASGPNTPGCSSVSGNVDVEPFRASATATCTAPELTTLAVTPSTSTITAGGTLAFTATGTYTDGSTQDLTNSVNWTSDTTTVATIAATGVATAINAGATTITATSGTIVGTAQLTVLKALTGITVAPTSATVNHGATQAFTATATYSDGSSADVTSSVTWTSSDPTRATISAAGLASTFLPGSVTITATLEGHAGTAQLTIIPALTQLSIAPATLSIAQNTTASLVATATWSDGTTTDVTATASWTSSAPATASVSAGTVTGVAPGTSTITATASGSGATASVTVTPVIESLSINPATLSIAVGQVAQLQAIATWSDGTTTNVTATASWTSANSSAATVSAGLVSAVNAGSTTITGESSGHSATAVVTVTAATLIVTGLVVTPASTNLEIGTSVQLVARATYSDGSTNDVSASASWQSSSETIATVSATGLVTAATAGDATITATLASFNASSSIHVNASQPLPPDPATIAPPIDQTVITTIAESTKFLYSGPNPIQTGVAPNAIDPVRAAVVRGRVLAHGGAPLAGVTVSIVGHPEFGQTLSRADGVFDLAVNGGATLTVRFTKSGYIGADREARPDANDFGFTDDLVMTTYDPAVTAVDLSATGMKVARGSLVGDDDGYRRATLLFSSGTSASMQFPDGSSQPLSLMNVRATEFTVGPEGPSAMPAPLPPSSGYTYCVELSADEAIAAGATSVDFSAPVALYFENFLQLPPGSHIPVGSYDAAEARWIPAENGKIVTIVGIVLDRAYLDVTGDGLADGPEAMAELGISDEERAALAGLYTVNQELWRVPIAHFSAWDANFPWGPVPGSTPPLPGDPHPKWTGRAPEHCTQCPGSIISVESQSLGEDIPITGTSLALHYESIRMRHSTASNSVLIAAIGAVPPPPGTKVELQVEVAGQRHVYQLSPQANQMKAFSWDGKNAFGGFHQGPMPIRTRLKYTYKAVYQIPDVPPDQLHLPLPLFARFSGNPLFAADRRLREYSFTSEWAQTILNRGTAGQWNAGGLGLGGWTLSAHHVYDYQSGTLHMGSGAERSLQGVGAVIKTFAGGAEDGSEADGVPAKSALLPYPKAMSIGIDGSLYVLTGGAMRRIAPSGAIFTVGTIQGSMQPSRIAVARDGSVYLSTFGVGIALMRGGTTVDLNIEDPLTGAPLDPQGIATDSQGDLWIATGRRVYKINNTGQILDWIGNGDIGIDGDEGPAHQAQLMNATEVAVAPDGYIFLSSPSGDNIRYVTPDGMIHAVRSGSESSFGSGGPVRGGLGFAVDREHNIYLTGLADFYFSRGGPYVWVVRPDGTEARIVGVGTREFAGDGGPALQAGIDPNDVQVARDGTLYVSDVTNNRIRSIGRAAPGLGRDELAVPSSDGSEIFVFSPNGRHLRTLNSLTGVVHLSFGYDALGLLVTITDADGNLVTVERTPEGRPTAIIAPGGQRTTLATDAGSALLTAITNPAGETYRFTHEPRGSEGLRSMTDPKQQRHDFTYDLVGLLVHDADPAGGSTTLARTGTDDSDYTVTRTTAEGYLSTHRVTTADDGSYTQTTTDAAGLQSTVQVSADGSRTATSPGGLTMTSLEVPDPRFGMQASYPSSLSLQNGSTTMYANRTRNITLTDPANPASPVASAVSTISLNGRTYSSFFNPASRSVTSTSPEGRTSTAYFDAGDRLASISVPLLTETQFAYDSRGLLTDIIRGTRATHFDYDAKNQLISITDPLSRTVRLEYDLAGRVTKQILPDNREILFGYDANGNMTSLTPPGRPAHAFGYTAVDLESRYDPPLVANGGATLFQYDRDRKLTSITRPDAATIAVGYDGAGRPGSLTIGRGVFGIAYDNTNGNVLTVTDPDGGALDYSYDGSVLTGTSWSGTVSGSISWTYDAELALASETVACVSASTAACQPVDYGYDQDKLLTAAGPMTLTRDPQNGRLAGTQAGVVSDLWTYNSHGEPVTYTANGNGAPIFGQQFTRDDAGRITRKVETVNGTITTYDYAYDAAGRLTDVTRDGAPLSQYGYDTNGNRILRSTPVSTETGSFDDQDRCASYGGTTYNYSANGELLSTIDATGTTLYQYDELGNLLRTERPNGDAIDYVIDASNRRVGRKVNGVLMERILYSDDLRPAAELDADGNVSARFVHASRGNVPDLLIKGDTTFRVISDHLGSPRLVVDTVTGVVVQQLDYDEFGNVLADTNPGFQPFGFAGGLYDRDTGLTRFGARDYDPKTGRWTAKDPIGFGGGDTGLYSYVGNDPVNFVDPSGLKLCQKWLPGVGSTYLDDEFARKVDDFMYTANELGVHDLKVTSAFRPTAYQQQLRNNPTAHGATTPAKNSLHSAGWALDVNYRSRSAADQESIRHAATVSGLDWGGNFTKPDDVHFFIDPTGGSIKKRKKLIEQAQNDYAQGGACGCN